MPFRRSPHLVGYWQGTTCLAVNYRSGVGAPLTPDLLSVLDALSEWTTVAALARRLGVSVAGSRRVLAALVKSSLVEHRAARARVVTRPNDRWAVWDPAAGFFHFTTRDTRFNKDFSAGEQRLVVKAKSDPAPAATLTRRGLATVSLEHEGAVSALEQVLTARRTWRRFSRAPVARADLARLLRLTVGVQQWARTPSRPRAPLKTSPSGGMCHPIEAYVVARHVSGLSRGIYHYDAARHRLVLIRRGATSRTINSFIQVQPWFGRAPLLVVLTAVFARSMWRYPIAKAYRNVLIEAGHVCQTFYLLATEMGLAPFCTQAVNETAIASALRLDPAVEDVVYVAGCGKQPRGGWSLGLPSLEWWDA